MKSLSNFLNDFVIPANNCKCCAVFVLISFHLGEMQENDAYVHPGGLLCVSFPMYKMYVGVLHPYCLERSFTGYSYPYIIFLDVHTSICLERSFSGQSILSIHHRCPCTLLFREEFQWIVLSIRHRCPQICPHNGVLWMQKLRAQGYQRCPLFKPGVQEYCQGLQSTNFYFSGSIFFTFSKSYPNNKSCGMLIVIQDVNRMDLSHHGLLQEATSIGSASFLLSQFLPSGPFI